MIKLFEEYSDKYDIWLKYGLDIDQIDRGGVYDGDIDIRHSALTEIPNFGIHTLNGNFACSGNRDLQSLKNVPVIILGDFNCSSCRIESLQDGPRTVNGEYNCSFNRLKDLKSPLLNFKNTFKANGNFIASLENSPNDCDELLLDFNRITSLDFIPSVRRLKISDNYLLSDVNDNPEVIVKQSTIFKNKISNKDAIVENIKEDLIFCFELMTHKQILSQLQFFKKHSANIAYDIMFDILKEMGYSTIEPEEDESELF